MNKNVNIWLQVTVFVTSVTSAVDDMKTNISFRKHKELVLICLLTHAVHQHQQQVSAEERETVTDNKQTREMKSERQTERERERKRGRVKVCRECRGHVCAAAAAAKPWLDMKKTIVPAMAVEHWPPFISQEQPVFFICFDYFDFLLTMMLVSWGTERFCDSLFFFFFLFFFSFESDASREDRKDMFREMVG